MKDMPPLRTVYGVLLNHSAEHEAWSHKMNDAPYKAPPQAPVLYLKPANTFSPSGASIAVPARVPQVEIGATVAMVIGAQGRVAGHVLMNDLSIPHDSYFRPPVKFKCLDGFLGIGDTWLPADGATDASRFALEVRVNGSVVQRVAFADLVRPAARLLADVSEFMSLAEGDALMLGTGPHRPLAKVGDTIEIQCDGLGYLTNALVEEAP